MQGVIRSGLIINVVEGAGGIIAPGPAGWSGPTSGLIHRWPLALANFVSGADDDVVGTDNITESGTVSSTSGPSGAADTARLFDGATGFGTLASSPLPASGPFTVSLWGFDTNAAQGGLSVTPLNFGTNANANVLRIGASPSNPFIVQYSGPAGVTLDASTAKWASSGWTNVVVTFDGSSTSQLFVNAASASTATGIMGQPSFASDTIGVKPATASFWPGALAQLAVYNRVLSGSEITQLFNAQ
jgi:hypothetical protein